MSEERKLLELAAKAIGGLYCGKGVLRTEVNGEYGWEGWNPLTDDGDLHRLARKCKMVINFDFGSVETDDGVCFFTPGNDHEEAMAILRAAAAIGGNM